MFTNAERADEQNRSDERGNCEHEFDHLQLGCDTVLVCCFCRATYLNGVHVE